jgi:hypothetical protein
MVVAVPLVRVVQMAFHKIVSMAAMRNRFMTAAAAMRVFRVVRSAGMARRAGGRIRAALAKSMLIHVSGVCVVQMAVVQIIDVIFMLNRSVSAS